MNKVFRFAGREFEIGMTEVVSGISDETKAHNITFIFQCPIPINLNFSKESLYGVKVDVSRRFLSQDWKI